MPFWLACAYLLARPVLAHDFWIQASDFRPPPGVRVELSLRVGQDFGGEVLPRIDEWIVRFDYHDAGGLQPVPGELGDDPAGYLPAVRTSTLVAYQGERDGVKLKPAKFHAYLRDEGLEWVIAERERRGEADWPAREWYTRHAKALICVGEGAPGWDFRFGLPLELEPERDPCAWRPGQSLPMRLLFRGRPIEGVLVTAYRDTDPQHKIRQRTDAEGRVSLPLDGPGVWLIKAVHMVRAGDDDPEWDWGSYWASFTFER